VRSATIRDVSDRDELFPADPDEDDLPEELRAHPGPWLIGGVDEDGNVFSAPITRAQLAAAFADARRAQDGDAA
jgi:hypothetical protein